MDKGSKTFAAILSISAFSTAIPALTAPALAQAGPASAPAAAEVQQMKIVVAEVKGLVQVRTAENAPWQMAKAGMELDQGAEFRTGSAIETAEALEELESEANDSTQLNQGIDYSKDIIWGSDQDEYVDET